MAAGRRAERRDLTYIFDSSDQSSYIRSDMKPRIVCLKAVTFSGGVVVYSRALRSVITSAHRYDLPRTPCTFQDSYRRMPRNGNLPEKLLALNLKQVTQHTLTLT